MVADTAAAFATICRTRDGQPGDAVDELVPRHVVSPSSPGEVGEVMAAASAHAMSVVARGHGGRQHWGPCLTSCDVVLDLSGLDTVRDYAPGDMVIDVEAGVSMRRLAEVTAEGGQQLALDTGPGTVGGTISTAEAGPRRFKYGTARDLLLGVTIVRADGVTATSGGRVVKNVAGYDLGKLFTGAWGTLGIVVAATWRLHPIPEATAWVTAVAADAAGAQSHARALIDRGVDPAAVELYRPGSGAAIEVAALLEGTVAGLDTRAAVAASLTGGEVSETAPGWWRGDVAHPGDTVLTVATLAGQLAATLEVIAIVARESDVDITVHGSAAAGILRVVIDGAVSVTRLASLVDALRERVPSPCVVILRSASPAVRRKVDVWGYIDPGARELMRSIARQFDPHTVLAVGRSAGGHLWTPRTPTKSCLK